MRVTIFVKIIGGFAMLLLLGGGIGLYTFITFKQSNQQYSKLLVTNKELINGVRTMQVNFKKQVQEWKDLLLRGSKPEDFEHYFDAFQTKYEEIQAQGKALQQYIEIPENTALLQEFLEAHQHLQQQYLTALEGFRAGGGKNYQETDQAVRGIDRRPTDMFDTLVENIIKEADLNSYAIEQHTQTIEQFSAVLSGLALVVMIGVSLIIARKLSVPIVAISRALREVSTGNLDVSLPAISHDEIGDLASSTQMMMAYIREATDVAEKVSNLDLHSEVKPKSASDVLNQSLVKMVTNLRLMIAESEQAMTAARQQNEAMKQQNWLKDGVSQLSSTLAGDNSLKEVCQKAINVVARYINAGRGVLYSYDTEKEQLTLQSGFAFAERDHLSNAYKLGEGVVGQVALEREPILLKHLSRQESAITTGLTSAAPLNTYTFPLLYEGDLYGVIELASFEPFETITQEFLTEANRVIATALFSTGQRERVQKLLQASQQAAQEAERAKADAQQQAEESRRSNVLLEEKQQELEQQSEELRQMNAHLEEQQHQLEQQREELRQQQQRLTQTQ